MKKLCIILLFISSLWVWTSPSFAYLKGDINDDGRIGIHEAIYALQVTSGIKSPTPANIINVPGDVSTIQQAIDAAATGNTINVSTGTFTEALTINKSVTLKGAGKDVTNS